MIDLTSRVLETGLQVLLFQVRELLEDFRPSQARGEKIKHVGNAHSHAPNAGASPALFRVDGDSRGQVRHVPSVAYR